MSDQTTLATAPTEPAPAPVIELRPNGVVIRCEEHHAWVTVRRDGRTGSEQRFTWGELREFVEKAQRVLA